MINNRGFTLTELIVVMVIVIVVLLTIVALSEISNRSYTNLRNETEVYNDIYFGFNLISHYIRNSSKVSVNSTQDELTAGEVIFRKSGANFIYHDNLANTDHNIITQVNNLACSFVPSVNNKLITVTLSGNKGRVSFNLSTDIKLRN